MPTICTRLMVPIDCLSRGRTRRAMANLAWSSAWARHLTTKMMMTGNDDKRIWRAIGQPVGPTDQQGRGKIWRQLNCDPARCAQPWAYCCCCDAVVVVLAALMTIEVCAVGCTRYGRRRPATTCGLGWPARRARPTGWRLLVSDVWLGSNDNPAAWRAAPGQADEDGGRRCWA